MDILILLTYAALCIAVFKIFKIPLNKWSVPTAILGGVAILSAILFTMNYIHPYAKYAKEVFITIPIVPEISGTVKTLDVVANQFVTQGTILFTLENEEQEIALEKAEAALVQAKNEVLQKSSSLNSAIAQTAKAKANRDRSQATYLRYQEANDKAGENAPFTQQEVDSRKKIYEADEAALQGALAEEERQRLVTESKILGENTEVAQLQAARNKAKLDLERTIIRAPVDGIPTQLGIRPGVRAASLPLRPVMVFIPSEKRRIAAMFWQNSLTNMKKGLEAEVVLDAVPGYVFKGKLVDVLPGMSEGEFQFNGSLISADTLTKHGFVIGVIELDEDLNDYNLPLGVEGQAVAINHENDIMHVSLIRRILIRMMAWLKYVYPIK